MIGRSPRFRRMVRAAARIARTDATVLISGESGTGKEVLARYIHEKSGRSGPFKAVNCAAIPRELLESEFFGHERGAFTGAVGRRIGHFERAAEGTLFLDEIADMRLPLQAKILRVLEAGVVERVGGDRPISVRTRVIAATNRDLPERIKAGVFRPDLYYRLAVLDLKLPPLRERANDVPLLADYFCEHFARKHGRDGVRLSAEAKTALAERPWPGNIRQLRNAIERAVLLANDRILGPEAFIHASDGAGERAPEPVNGEVRRPERRVSRLQPLDEVVRRHIRHALEITAGNRTRAAELLGIHRNTLGRKLRS